LGVKGWVRFFFALFSTCRKPVLSVGSFRKFRDLYLQKSRLMPITIELPCKPYVKQFLELNYGSPIELKPDRVLFTNFLRCLKKPNKRYDYKKADVPSLYSEITRIVISEDSFYRYGWELTRTDIIAFGKEIECRVKFFMRQMVSQYSTVMNLKDSIYMFQTRFGFTEEIWSYESIKKDFYRNGPKSKTDLGSFLAKRFEQISLENLSSLGTISQTLITDHEYNSKAG